MHIFTVHAIAPIRIQQLVHQGDSSFAIVLPGTDLNPPNRWYAISLEVTFSNEVELGSLSQEFVSNGRGFFHDFMPRCEPYVSQAAFEAAVKVFNLPV